MAITIGTRTIRNLLFGDDLELGTLKIGVLCAITGYILCVLSITLMFITGSDYYFMTTIITSLQFFFNVLLIVGTWQKYHYFLMLWIVYNTLTVVFILSDLIIGTYFTKIVTTVDIAMWVYFWCCGIIYSGWVYFACEGVGQLYFEMVRDQQEELEMSQRVVQLPTYRPCIVELPNITGNHPPKDNTPMPVAMLRNQTASLVAHPPIAMHI